MPIHSVKGGAETEEIEEMSLNVAKETKILDFKLNTQIPAPIGFPGREPIPTTIPRIHEQ
jgi:hypothetical protein